MSVADINGKKILFFTPTFFNYENMIADKMREMGAEVDMFNVRSVTSSLNRALLKISPDLFLLHSLRYYQEIIQSVKDRSYDYILIVKCDMTPVRVLKELRRLFPKAKLCLYLWDSVKNIPGILKKLPYFDVMHSFDINDCARYPGLQFRPLFFGDEFVKRSEAEKDDRYDISFLGTVHSDRFAVIRQVQKIADATGLKCFWFLYLQSRFVYFLYKLTKKEFRAVPEDTFSYEKMPASKIAEIVDESRIILDIQHPRQTGLTMRTIEMIGMRKKLITTNESIKEYDFYDENNVMVIDRKQVRIPAEFLQTAYHPLPAKTYEKYSLSSWILDVLS